MWKSRPFGTGERREPIPTRFWRQDPRAAGTLEPFWNMLDLTPAGRPDFNEQLQYGCCSGNQPRALKEM